MLLKYIKPYAARMAGGFTVKFLGSVMDLLLPWILAYMIDTVVPTGSMARILWWGAAMLGCSVVAVLGNIIANRMASRVARDVIRTLRHDLFDKITRLSAAQVDEAGTPTLVSRLSSDSYNVHRMVSSVQRMGVRAPILLIGGIIITLTLEPVLTLTLFATLPFITLVVYRVSRRGIPLYTKLQQAVDAMVRTVRESAAGMRVIKALGKGADEKAHFAQVNGNVTQSEQKAATTMAASNPLMNLFLNLGLTLVVVVGAFRVNAGLAQPGKILAFLSYFTIISGAMMAVTRLFVMLSQGSASANRIASVMALPSDLTVQPPDAVQTGDHIRFENVGFAYTQTAQRALNGLSLALQRGRTLGVIGATGSGKTTLVQLLMRLYDVDEGCVRIDGEDVRGIEPKRLHSMFGVVFQHDVLFADTVRENIAFGRSLADEDIIAAAKDAQAWEFIEQLEGGLDYRLASRGANLSGGQRQRLLIARALAGKPEILVLDDASSALDYRTDAKLRAAIRRHYQGVTVVVVAQRVSSVMGADLVLMLDDGEVAGLGTHEELLASCAPYREIYQSQTGGITHAG